MYGQKRDPKDVKTQPQEEFITQTNHNSSQAKEEMPAKPDTKAVDDVAAREIDEEGWEAYKDTTDINPAAQAAAEGKPETGEFVEKREKSKADDINH